MRTRVHAKRAHTRTHICDDIYGFGATIGNSQARCACSRTLRPRTVRKRTSAGARGRWYCYKSKTSTKL